MSRIVCPIVCCARIADIADHWHHILSRNATSSIVSIMSYYYYLWVYLATTHRVMSLCLKPAINIVYSAISRCRYIQSWRKINNLNMRCGCMANLELSIGGKPLRRVCHDFAVTHLTLETAHTITVGPNFSDAYGGGHSSMRMPGSMEWHRGYGEIGDFLAQFLWPYGGFHK